MIVIYSICRYLNLIIVINVQREQYLLRFTISGYHETVYLKQKYTIKCNNRSTYVRYSRTLLFLFFG